MLKAKYNKGRGFELSDIVRGSSPSHFWADVTSLWGKVSRLCLWRVGDGSGVKMWNDCWVDKGTCLKDVVFDIGDISDPKALIGEFVDTNDDWDVNLLK